jgi:hypothetical protein
MQDTPEHIKQLQLKIWLAKPPAQRLHLTLLANEQLWHFWKAAKKNLDSNSHKK